MVIEAVPALSLGQWSAFFGGSVDSGEVHGTGCCARGGAARGGWSGCRSGRSLWGLEEPSFIVQHDTQLDKLVEGLRGGRLVTQRGLEAMIGTIDKKGDLGTIVIVQSGSVCCELCMISATILIILAKSM